jgi:hypothetical protein
MKALIDADILPYEFGSATDEEYRPLPWMFVKARVLSRIRGILDATGADSYKLYLTSEDKSNFRYDLATIKPYKGNRPTEKPYWYSKIREFLIKYKDAEIVYGMEADDALAIEQYNSEEGSTIICSRDKDLKMVPGWHYSWPTGNQPETKPFFVTELEGLKSFYKQLLTGDPVDNILGLYGVGKSSKLLSHIDSSETELEMCKLVREQYEKRFGAYWIDFLLENARLLWMKRTKDDVWRLPNELLQTFI